MEAITDLRKLARERRDKAINAAKRQYAATLERIAAVEQDILGHLPSDHKRMADVVQTVIPTDRPFTTGDIMAALRAAHPDRECYMRTVTNQIGRLRAQGFIRRIRRPTRTTAAIYACVQVEVPESQLGDKALADVAAEVLEGTSMNATELAVAVLAAGYRTRMGNRALRAEINTSLRKQPERFYLSGKKWERASC